MLAALLVLFTVDGKVFATDPHYVFAHYMVCYATYGESVDAYKREIKEAQAAGIDGFALNVGAWDDTQAYYKKRVGMLYDAAEQLGTGFKLFFSVDFGDATNIVKMVEAYGNRPASFRFQNRIVLSAYGWNDVPSRGWPGLDWTNGVVGTLSSNGFPVFFVPFFFSDPVRELPAFTDAMQVLTKYNNLVDGLFCWSAAGMPPELAQSNSNYTRAVRTTGKISMAGVSPHYWGNQQPSIGRRYYETQGGEGVVCQWFGIITNQPDWVEICTWNDFNESTYISPVQDAGQYLGVLATPHRYSHEGYLELFKHYIAWYKNGREPAIDRDAVFYFYRTHGKDAVAANTNDVPVTWRYGDVADTIYATLFLKAPASLEVVSGANRSTNSASTGISHVRIPFAPGPQILTLRREGSEIIRMQGPDIQSAITNYDFFPASGYGYARPETPNNLRVLRP